MLRNYFKIAWRSLQKNKLYTGINVFGLTIGLAACLLIGVYIFDELSYDTFHENAARIVRATMEYKQNGTVNTVATTGTKVGPQFKRSFPLVEEYTRTFIRHNVVKAGEKMFDEGRILYADPAFFKIFSFPILQGTAATALAAPDNVVLTQATAKKYFGTEDPINKTITVAGKDLRVVAVCADVPPASQLHFDFVTPFLNLGNNVKDETWWTANWVTYFLVQDARRIPELQQQVKRYMNSPAVKSDAGLESTDYLTYNLEPLLQVHLHSALEGFEPNGNITYIYMFGIIALLILIIACANYTNLATAQSEGRRGEIGMRKVLGASKQQVFLQFMGESSLTTIIAAVLAVVLCLFLLPYFNLISGKTYSTAALLQPLPVIALVLFVVLVSFFSGLYPALVLSGMQVMGVLKKGFSFTGGNNLLRRALIVAQFGISVFLIIYTVIILQQLHFIQTKNLGYNKDHVVVLPIGGTMSDNFQNLKAAFAQVPGVEGVTASYETPEYVQWGDAIRATDERGTHQVTLNALPVDLDFANTLKMQLAAGRDFQESDFSLMDTADNYANFKQPYLINEALAKKLGWTPGQALDRTITKNAPGPVVGVVKDFNFSSLHEPIGPLVLFLSRDLARDFMIRIDGRQMPQTLAALETVWKQRVPDRPFAYHFLVDDYNKLYAAEQRTSLLFSVAAGLAIVLACLGLFGMAAFTTVQRTKEIGIRRILGASVSTIILLIARNALQLVGISILVAVPLAWWAGNHWLQDFAFRIPVRWSVFMVTALCTVMIAFCTVGYQALKAATANPVTNLRAE